MKVHQFVAQGRALYATVEPASHVELKSTWIEPAKAARRLAGQANSARGEPILWVVGVAEHPTSPVVGAGKTEMADWWTAVRSNFTESVFPDLLAEVPLTIDGLVVVALLFATDRAPYIVNTLGRPEIPFRHGTRVDPARREDLLRLLLPPYRPPRYDVMHGNLSLDLETAKASLSFQLYVYPQAKERALHPVS